MPGVVLVRKTIYTLTLVSAFCMIALTACSNPPSGTPPHKTAPERSNPPKNPAALSRYPGHVLKSGNHGPDVTELQAKLNKLGYSKSPANGNYGSATIRAVKSFQNSDHLKVNGEVGRLTWNALFAKSTAIQTSSKITAKSKSRSPQTTYPNTVLTFGSQGKYVKDIQNRLKALGYLHGVADGVFGSETVHALQAFQRADQFAPSGQVDYATWTAMFTNPTPVRVSTISA